MSSSPQSAVFAEFLDYTVIPLLQTSFVELVKSFPDSDSGEKLVGIYQGLPELHARRFHAAFDIVSQYSNKDIHFQRIASIVNDPSNSNVYGTVMDYLVESIAVWFPLDTDGYHIHVYFDKNTVDEASGVRQVLQSMRLRCFNLVHYPIGPHPVPMFECHVYTPEDYYRATLYLRQQRLSVLLHPTSGTFVEQHFDKARWINEKLPLIKLSNW